MAVKILFFGRHFTYFRNFESVLRGLAERGTTSTSRRTGTRADRRPAAGADARRHLPERHLRRRAAARGRRRRVGRQSSAARPRLPALPASDLRPGADAARALARQNAGDLPHAGPHRAAHRRAGATPARRYRAEAGTLRARGSGDPRVHHLAQAGRRAHHAAHRSRLAADRLSARAHAGWAFPARCACGAGITCRARR